MNDTAAFWRLAGPAAALVANDFNYRPSIFFIDILLDTIYLEQHYTGSRHFNPICC
jgi:hypothetical protein